MVTTTYDTWRQARQVFVPQETWDEFQALLSGRFTLTPQPEQPGKLPPYLLGRAPALPTVWAQLTETDFAVLHMLSEGATDTAIARKIGLAPSSIGNYVQRLYHRCGAKNRAHLVKRAFEHGVFGGAR